MRLVETGKYLTHIRLVVSHGVESLCGGWGRNGEGIAKTRSQQLSRDRTDKAVHSNKRQLTLCEGSERRNRGAGKTGKANDTGQTKARSGSDCGGV